MASGLLLVLTAGVLLATGGSRTAVGPDPALTPFPTVGTATSSYGPGHTSGWHVHPGVHSVVVLSGTLTVYDENCVRTDYGPGQSYLGGAIAACCPQRNARRPRRRHHVRLSRPGREPRASSARADRVRSPMSRSPGGRVGAGDDGAIFLLIAAPEPTPRANNSRPPVEVFTSEGVAREAFVRRRLEVGSGSAWVQLVAVEGQAIRPLCWFGRSPGPLPAPRRLAPNTRRRWAVAALALSIAAVQGVDAGRTSVVLPAHPGRSR